MFFCSRPRARRTMMKRRHRGDSKETVQDQYGLQDQDQNACLFSLYINTHTHTHTHTHTTTRKFGIDVSHAAFSCLVLATRLSDFISSHLVLTSDVYPPCRRFRHGSSVSWVLQQKHLTHIRLTKVSLTPGINCT